MFKEMLGMFQVMDSISHAKFIKFIEINITNYMTDNKTPVWSVGVWEF